MLSPRAEALHLVKAGQEIPPPDAPDLEPGSPEALAFLDSIKPRHFAALAGTIDLLVGHVFEQRSARPPEEFGGIVRHPGSRIILQKLAKTCVYKMIAGLDALTGEPDNRSPVTLRSRPLIPELFRLREHADGSRSLDYADFSQLKVPAGYESYLSKAPLENETPVSEIPCRRPVVVGCPLTLIKGLLGELLDWQASIVESRGLWQNVQAPAYSPAR